MKKGNTPVHRKNCWSWVLWALRIKEPEQFEALIVYYTQLNRKSGLLHRAEWRKQVQPISVGTVSLGDSLQAINTQGRKLSYHFANSLLTFSLSGQF